MALRIASFVSVLFILLGAHGTAAGADRVPPSPAVTTGEAKHPKLSVELRERVRLHRSSGPAALADAAEQVVIQTTAEDIAAVKSHVQAAGGTFEMATGDLVLARIPVSALDTLASADAVKIVRRPRAPTPLQTTGEGVHFIGAGSWHSAGRKGAGVKIAILDVGFDGYQSLMGSELPSIPAARIRSFSGDISGGGKEHGTGVAEIVYDIAPAADLYLVNFSNEVELENAVQWLIDERVHVINASWGYPCGGPLDGTGRTNAVVKRAADAGILWVSAAGNYAQRHWSSTFNDIDGDAWHNFSATEEGNTVFMSSGDELSVCVEWDDWTNKDQDLELYVWDSNGNVVDASTEDQSGPATHDPWERLDFTANATGEYYIGVKRYSGTRNPRLQLYAYPPGTECAIETAAGASSKATGLLSELRRFRDVVLASSPAGRAWIESYYRHSREVRRILLLHPRLAIEAAALLNASRPAVRSVLATRSGPPSGGQFVIPQDYASRVDRFLEQLIPLGSPRLRDDLAEFRARAAFSAAAGQTADQYWDGLLEQSPIDSGRAGEAYPDSGYMLYTTPETSLVPPADSPHAFTVGAIDWSTGAMEAFSSRGPTADGRRKPDIAAPDGVCTVTYAECGANGFRGTSAAAPHAAGAVALVRQAYPGLNVAAVRNFLTARAVDIGAVGPDNQTGAGRLALGPATDVDVLPAPTLLHPKGSASPLAPGYVWSEVGGAAGYRLMVATSQSLLPTDPGTQTCGGCLINTTTPNTYFTPSMTLLPGTTYYWQVQALGAAKKGLWAQSSFMTMVAPEQTLPELDDVSEATGRWPTPAGKAVVITHGWRSGAVDTWVQEMARAMCKKIGVSQTTSPVQSDGLTKMCQANGWDIWVLDWSQKARTGLPWNAFANATQIGEIVATKLKTKNYAHVHLIAHSAGSNLIDFTSIRLKYWMIKEHRPPLEIHNTFLDAYEPLSDSWRYGSHADWTDNYVDTRDVLDLFLGFDGTKLFLHNGYNVDVTASGNLLCLAICRHSRPYRFYGRSVDSSFVGSGLDAALDPISGTGGMGYPLSTQNGIPLSSLNESHRAGKKCVMNGNTCATEDVAAGRPSFTPARVTRAVKATAGAVTYVVGFASAFDSIRLGSVPLASVTSTVAVTPAAAPTEAPSWIVVDVTTAEPVNKLRFHWRFGAAGQGFLRVFVDGMLVREIDQRHVPATSAEAEEIYVGGAAGTLAPGTHRIVLRLDGFAAGASGVELTAVDLGLVAPGTRRRAARH